MAITETRPATETEVVPFVGLIDHDPGGLAGFIGTGDHKALGRAYMGFASLFGLGAFVLAVLYQIHGASDTFLTSGQWAERIYSLSRIGGVLLFAIPFFIGLATYLCPLQVGANTVAFPRAASAAFWGWLVGSGVLIAAYFVDGGADGSKFKSVDLSYVALIVVLVALLLATVTVLTTVIALRTGGLWLDRVPLFSWAMFVAGSLWLFTLPVLAANVLLIYVDHHYGAPIAFGVQGSQWAQLSWLFGQPAIYIVVIPVLGIVGDAVSTLVGVRVTHRRMVMTFIGAFGILSFGAFAQPVFNPNVRSQALYVAMSFLIVLPVLALVGSWAMTLRAGKVSFKSPVLLSLVAGLTLLLATVAGLVFSISGLDLHDSDYLTSHNLTSAPFADGQFYLLLGVVVLGAIAGVAYWGPKLFGRFVNEPLAGLAALIGLVGALVAGVALMVYGFAAKSSSLDDSAKFLNGLSGAGAAVLALALLVGLLAVLAGRGKGTIDDDAWGSGQTLEWATGSPPPPGNFGLLPPVASAEPLLDAAATQEGTS